MDDIHIPETINDEMDTPESPVRKNTDPLKMELSQAMFSKLFFLNFNLLKRIRVS